MALLGAVLGLPRDHGAPDHQTDELGFKELLSRRELLRNYLVAFGAFWVFSASFNYLPFYLSGPPFFVSTQVITLIYLTYLVGAAMGPLAGRLSNRIGNGTTIALGATLFGVALMSTLIPSLIALVFGLAGVCAGFFTTHSAATGGLNRKLTTSRGRANALYVLFYYVGGYCGITVTGFAYQQAGWPAVVALGLVVLLLPISIGLLDRRLTTQPQR
jgi:YNFM family putative membrane transporter